MFIKYIDAILFIVLLQLENNIVVCPTFLGVLLYVEFYNYNNVLYFIVEEKLN